MGATTFSIDGERAMILDDGAEKVVEACPRAVRYLAVAGAFAVEPLLGSRSTLLVAKIGGFEGRALRAGDELPVGSSSGRALAGAIPTVSDPPDPAAVQVFAGPHLARFAAAALTELVETTWQISPHGDRVGVRLDGGKISRAPAPPFDLPAPMVRGAVQITTDGTPIVLGPDHPVTGGYPVLAVVSRASQSTLARLRAKRVLRFTLGPSPGA
jgi:allophanate hydrolase subunit 2